jgi:hypothetical protein
VVHKVALGQVFLRVLRFYPANIIPPLLHEVCDSSYQAAHYHHLGPKLGASSLTQHFGWKQNKKVKKKSHLFAGGSGYNKYIDKLSDCSRNGTNQAAVLSYYIISIFVVMSLWI